jgi:hypothetical protein
VVLWNKKCEHKIPPILDLSIPRTSSTHLRELGLHDTGKITLYMSTSVQILEMESVMHSFSMTEGSSNRQFL